MTSWDQISGPAGIFALLEGFVPPITPRFSSQIRSASAEVRLSVTNSRTVDGGSSFRPSEQGAVASINQICTHVDQASSLESSVCDSSTCSWNWTSLLRVCQQSFSRGTAHLVKYMAVSMQKKLELGLLTKHGSLDGKGIIRLGSSM